MKSVLRYTAAGLALATVGFASNASAATGSAQATAEILSNLTVTANVGDSVLNFGSINAASLAADSTVVVSPADARTCGANLTCSGAAAAPTFTVTGFAGQTVAVSFPASQVTLTRALGPIAGLEDEMEAGSFTTSASNVTLTGGTGTFSIGGTLTVHPLQAPGVYTGAVSVQVEYN